MQFSTLVAMLSSAIAVSSSPVDTPKIGGVLLCTGANATGTCEHRVFELKECHQLSKPYYKNVKTFVPDRADFFCYPRLTDCGQPCKSPTGCTFGVVDSTYANKYNLSAISWDHMLASFDCFERAKRD